MALAPEHALSDLLTLPKGLRVIGLDLGTKTIGLA